MGTYAVVIWQDTLSDGAVCYSAWCPSVLGVSGQGDTEADAMADILSAMAANVFDPWPADWPVIQNAETADAELRQLAAELSDSGAWHRRHQVTQDTLRAAYRPAPEATSIVV